MSSRADLSVDDGRRKIRGCCRQSMHSYKARTRGTWARILMSYFHILELIGRTEMQYTEGINLGSDTLCTMRLGIPSTAILPIMTCHLNFSGLDETFFFSGRPTGSTGCRRGKWLCHDGFGFVLPAVGAGTMLLKAGECRKFTTEIVHYVGGSHPSPGHFCSYQAMIRRNVEPNNICRYHKHLFWEINRSETATALNKAG